MVTDDTLIEKLFRMCDLMTESYIFTTKSTVISVFQLSFFSTKDLTFIVQHKKSNLRYL